MTVLRVTEDGDLDLPLGASKFVVIDEPEATLQGLRDALRVAIGDWFLDLSAGVDREVLLGKLQSLLPPEVEIRRVLARVRGVTQVLRVQARRVATLAEAQSLGSDVTAAWNAAPNRILYITAQVTSRTAGNLDLGFALPLTPSP